MWVVVEDGSDERRSDPFEPSRGVDALAMPSARLAVCPSASRACPSSFSFSFSPSVGPIRRRRDPSRISFEARIIVARAAARAPT